MTSFLHQLRLLLRRLTASPSFTLVSLLTLAIGIAGNVTIFTVINTLLLRPLPYPQSERLVLLWHTAPGIDLDRIGQADATYFRYLDTNSSLQSMALANDQEVTVGDAEGNPERLKLGRVTASFFDVIGLPPVIGRPLLEDDDRPGGAPVALISERLWQRRFGGDASVLGQRLELDGVSTEIVGVMPSRLAIPDRKTDLWSPLQLDRSTAKLDGFGILGIGRLREGFTAEQVEAEFNHVLSDMEGNFPADEAAAYFGEIGITARVDPAHEFLVGDLRAALWIVLAAVGFLLLIACANVANLFLARSEGRLRELAIRRALGESRLRMVVSTLIESTALGVLAGLLALPLGAAAIDLLVRYGPQELPRINEISIDTTVVLVTLAVSVTAGLLLGVLPALRAALTSIAPALTDSTRSMTGGRRRHAARAVLVSGQIALAIILLVGSGLAARSFARLSNVDPGFDPEDVQTFRLFLPETEYAEPAAVVSFYRRLTQALEALPGVDSVAAVSSLPMSGGVNGQGFIFDGRPASESAMPLILFTKSFTGDYLEALGIPLLEGRSLERFDEESGARVLLVNERLARHYWPGESAVGKRLISEDGPPEDPEEWWEVVGIVGDVRDRGLHQEPPELVYYPLGLVQNQVQAPRAMSFALRGRAAAGIAGAARQAVWAMDPNLPVADVSTLARIVQRSKQLRAFTMILLIVASGMALLLGAIGLYGVISYLVSQRAREIAVRMAVGARLADIRGMVLRDALLLSVGGVAFGLVGAFALTRSMTSLLYEISPLDPLTYATVPLLLLAVTMAASYLPARRAARVDPAEALRHD